MNIVHILKDGSIVKDITGHVVRMGDVKPLYQFIDTLNQNGVKVKTVHSEKLDEVKIC